MREFHSAEVVRVVEVVYQSADCLVARCASDLIREPTECSLRPSVERILLCDLAEMADLKQGHRTTVAVVVVPHEVAVRPSVKGRGQACGEVIVAKFRLALDIWHRFAAAVVIFSRMSGVGRVSPTENASVVTTVGGSNLLITLRAPDVVRCCVSILDRKPDRCALPQILYKGGPVCFCVDNVHRGSRSASRHPTLNSLRRF